MRKLRSSSGETLIETLVATVLILLTFVFLTTSVITASKINKKVESEDVSFTYNRQEKVHKILKIDYKDAKGAQEVPVTVYGNNGYYWYEKGTK